VPKPLTRRSQNRANVDWEQASIIGVSEWVSIGRGSVYTLRAGLLTNVTNSLTPYFFSNSIIGNNIVQWLQWVQVLYAVAVHLVYACLSLVACRCYTWCFVCLNVCVFMRINFTKTLAVDTGAWRSKIGFLWSSDNRYLLNIFGVRLQKPLTAGHRHVHAPFHVQNITASGYERLHFSVQALVRLHRRRLQTSWTRN